MTEATTTLTRAANGMVERFNGRISEVARQTRFASAAQLEQTLSAYLKTYNHAIPQRALGHQTPLQALKKWRADKPALFNKRVYEQAGFDTQSGGAMSLNPWRPAPRQRIPATR